MNLPSAMIVFGGTIGTVIVAFPLERVNQMGKVLGVAFRQEVTSERDLVTLFVGWPNGSPRRPAGSGNRGPR